MNRIIIIAIALLPGLQPLQAQDAATAHRWLDTLAGPQFWGRGYTNEGMHKAADYLASKYAWFGLQPVSNGSFLQPFTMPVNTFPGGMEVSINGKKLVPGEGFIVSADSRSVRAKGTLQQQDSTHFVDPVHRIIVSLEDKLTMDVAQQQADYTLVQVDKKTLQELPATIDANIESKVVAKFRAENICGWVKGTRQPDSILVITAHYDHLGGFGRDTYFPGANDNGSGTALLLGLAQYYAAHPQPYTIAFISFAAEEAGLVGSKYFTAHPLFPLARIRFLLNLDLEGNGQEGITVVNATEFPKAFELMKQVNDTAHLLVAINPRGKAANSDHYWFTEKGVPSFFFYTLGGSKAYHDVFDRPENVPLLYYDKLFRLIVDFNSALMN